MTGNSPTRSAWAVVLGLGCGAGALGLSWFTAARPWGLFHPIALLAVLLAGVGYTLVQARATDLSVWRRQPEIEDEAAIRRRLVELATVSRADGARGLEREIVAVRRPLERHGLTLLADGCPAAEVQAALSARAQRAADADLAPSRVWRLMSGAFVNGGVLVTAVAMVHALLAAPPTGPTPDALAGALTGAIYGMVVGLGVLHPNASRARALAREAAAQRHIWVEGLTAIAGGIHPRHLADRWGLETRAASSNLRSVA